MSTSNGTPASGSSTPPTGFQRYPLNKIPDSAISSLRQSSPHPPHPNAHGTHLAIPGSGLHRVLTHQDPGYIAAKFEGKQKQMEEGKLIKIPQLSSFLPSNSLQSWTS